MKFKGCFQKLIMGLLLLVTEAYQGGNVIDFLRRWSEGFGRYGHIGFRYTRNHFILALGAAMVLGGVSQHLTSSLYEYLWYLIFADWGNIPDLVL